ncbi:MAG TPA: hypothetical protein VHQ45_20400 [Gemmatimonadaceae bacterium]|nr:hypothetical protein [Gemmatimonadaceae bacterium]
MRPTRLLPLLAGVATALPFAAHAQRPAPDSATLSALRWRSVGPANMGGRVTDVEGIPSPSRTFYVATAAGGIYKTTNAGTTFRALFQNERVVSMGDLAIAPSDTNVLYAGTGEEDSRNSISPGAGVYKSTDGGLTWKLAGLEKTQAIGRIVVHPTDPNTAWVAALGHIWNANPDRGLYKTTDGGQSWRRVKFVSDKAGFVDVAIDPANPNVLYAASWERVRGPYFLKSGGPGSALWKSTDGGETWTEIAGGGFPETTKGRISIAIAPSNSRIIYTMVEADSARGEKPQKLKNGLYRSDDAGVTWRKMNDANVRPFYYSQVRVHPRNPERVWFSSTPVSVSNDGGKTIGTATNGLHVDHHAMWIDPNDPNHHVVGNDGGVAQSWDDGGSYDFMNQMALGQFYEVSYDMSVPYRVCGGLQDNGSWCGPSRRKDGELGNAFWFTYNGGDGFYAQQDPTDANIIYGESQGGNITRLNLATGERTRLVKPEWRPLYMQVEDSILVLRGDTTQPAPREVQRRIDALRARQRADSSNLDLRFNWNTPFLLSPHSPTTMYVGASRVLKSTKRGDELYPISPDLSKQERAKITLSMEKTGGITLDATGAETYGTVTALAESAVRPGLLYAGTDDGNLWLTRNDGATWEPLHGRFPGLPDYSYVVRIEPSRFDSATVYVAFDNHRQGDLKPYLYVSADFGRSFRSIVNDLPQDGVDFLHVVREDPVNRDLLFVGSDVAAYVSTDRGQSWRRFMSGMPTVPVHDLQIHPRDHEIIAATHGRSIWIADITPLQQMTDSVLAAGTHLFAPRTAYQYAEAPALGESTGDKKYEAQNDTYGAHLWYRMVGESAAPATQAAQPAQGNGPVRAPRPQASIVITDARGDTVKTLTGPASAGLHRVTWDFRGKAPATKPLSPAARRDSVLAARKVVAVLDSLERGGEVPKAALDRVRTALASGEGLTALFRRGGGGGGGAGAGGFVERPAERFTPARPAGAAAAGAPAGAAPAGGEDVPQDVLSSVFGALRAANALPRGGFGGGGGAPMVATGDYLVTLTANGQTSRQVLRVERVGPLAAVENVTAEEEAMPRELRKLLEP